MKTTFNIDKLLEPYKKGGTETSPVKRSLSTIASKLIVGNNLPPEIVGAAIFKVFQKMAHEGLEFKGDGTYGSKGRELFSCIRAQAIDMVEKKSVDDVVRQIQNMTACVVKDCPMRTTVLKKKSKWERIKLFLLKPRGFWRL